MLETLNDTFCSVRAKTSKLAKSIGPKRGIIAGAIWAAAVGAAFVVRALRQRAADAERVNEHGGAPTKKQRRKARHHAHAAQPA